MRAVPIRRAGNRTILFLGGDRELVMFLMLVCGVLVFSVMEWRSAIIGFGLWLVGMWGLRLMAKNDPRMRQKAQEFMKYHRYYPPRSSPWAPSFCLGKK